MPHTILSVQNLRINIEAEENFPKKLIKGISLEIPENGTLALIGGSGSGKTSIGLAILRLLPEVMRVEEGSILFEGNNLFNLSDEAMRQLRGRDISMIFQEPLSAFNPLFTVGFQIEEVLKFHTSLSRKERTEKILELLEKAGISEPKRIAFQYPHQLSGGLRQRAMIAQAIAAGPKLIIADEPTSNLDVTLQAMMIELFHKLKSDLKLSLLLITHDFGVVNELADAVVVLYDGRIVDKGRPKDILQNPAHPFTCELAEVIKS